MPESKRKWRWVFKLGEWKVGWITRRHGKQNDSPVDIETEDKNGPQTYQVPFSDTKPLF